ncbi:glycosyl hydrolase 108 family protein [Xinfangfangia sp. CPCC 101601]|uniref:Glycosyl hydrolase 108 family protein n=1 Tax=Pseudogemmobacter lacusdianii TaxID=3069608 RepID=A0ABU0VYW5_9RHOB|nr:glycosyl hydrolase 108 family protein [Xinfangfangia sp. CPCC 101601]MDQ2066733.1 glycosyl hydrolase 108 family protein [Xinfangfangia sp. CPCC 101601]
MRSNFEKSFELVVGHEGGFTNDRRDRGNWTTGKIGVGELKGTKFGISAMSYPHLDIKNITLDQAKAIYAKDFWGKAGCDQLAIGLDYIVFDAAVNHGVSRAVKLLQAAAGAGQDGILGPKTLAAVAKKDLTKLVKEFSVQRLMFWANISTFETYGLGWFRRGVDTTVTALAMAGLDQSKTEPANDNEEPSLLARIWRM